MVMVSVAELQKKTQENVLETIGRNIKDGGGKRATDSIYYFVEGKGLEEKKLVELIKDLEEARDNALGVTWSFSNNQDVTKDLIRDCTNINVSDEAKASAENISYQIQAVNSLLAARKVLELESGAGDKLDALKNEIVHSITPEAIQKFNAEVVKALKDAGVNDAKDKLKTARDFVSMDCEQFHVTTITKQQAKEGEKLVIETDTMLTGLTQSQKEQYESISDGDKDKPEWYNQLPDFDRKMVKNYADKIITGKVMLPTQTRKHLPGLRNAYEKSVFVADTDGENMTQVLSVLHTGTPSFHGKENKEAVTEQNLQQLKDFAGGKNINDNPLNSPQIFGGIPNFANDIDREAPGLIKNAQKGIGGSTTVTPFNAMRRFTDNDNAGFDKTLIEIGEHLKKSDYKDLGEFLVSGGGSSDLPKLIKSQKRKIALEAAIAAKEMIMQPAAMLESENQNLELVSKMCMVDYACNHERGALNQYLSGLNTEKLNVHCASGKDRTGIALALATNQAVSQHLGLGEEKVEANLKTQIRGGHHQLLASVNGGTPGCHGVKSDSKTALPANHPLNDLIEKTAGCNKFKTPKTFVGKVKDKLKKVGMVLLAIVTLPITIPAALIAGAYLATKATAGAGYKPDQEMKTEVSKKVEEDKKVFQQQQEKSKRSQEEKKIAKAGSAIFQKQVVGERQQSQNQETGRGLAG
jgi:hypothetical protein